ncbi:MAG: SDR family oxidoreductase [Deltaproteobacteria bacterium]|nr:SDR family oxidoreductase [Deltaproteobacteria bacterium]
MTQSALVTGGAGFIGSHLVDRLVREGWRVRVLDDFSSGREQNLAASRAHIELLKGDLCDDALAARAVAGVDVVFHEAAVPSVPRSVAEPVRTNRVNVAGTLGLLEAARQAGVRRFVFAASSSAYGNTEKLPKAEEMPPTPESPYALQKLAGEEYCRLYTKLYGFETVSLRYFNVFGPRQNPESEYAAVVPRFITACLAGRAPTIYGDGEQTRDFTFVGDVVEANWLAAHSAKAVGSVMNVAGGKRISLNELLRAIQSIAGTRLTAKHEPARAGDVKHSLASMARAEALLGFRPQTTLLDGLAVAVESYQGARS